MHTRFFVAEFILSLPKGSSENDSFGADLSVRTPIIRSICMAAVQTYKLLAGTLYAAYCLCSLRLAYTVAITERFGSSS